MKLEHQVISLPLAKRLKELGVRQESYFWWEQSDVSRNWYLTSSPDNENTNSHLDRPVAAFTVAELGEMLADGMERCWKGGDGSWRCTWTHSPEKLKFEHDSQWSGDTEAEARGLMLAYLIENKLISL